MNTLPEHLARMMAFATGLITALVAWARLSAGGATQLKRSA